MPSKVEWGRDSYQASQGSSNRTLQVESKDQWVQGAYRIAVKPHDATQGRQEAGQAGASVSASGIISYILPSTRTGRMDAVTNSTSYKLVNDFYDANTEAMTPRSRNIADDGVDPKAIEESLNNFQDTTRTLLKGLTALGQLHPFVAGLPSSQNDRTLISPPLSCRWRVCIGYHHGHRATRQRSQGASGQSSNAGPDVSYIRVSIIYHTSQRTCVTDHTIHQQTSARSSST